MEKNKLTLVERLFELDDHEFRIVTIDDKPWWFTSDVGAYLGYAPKSLVTRVRDEWADELEEGADFRKIEGEELADLKRLVTESVTSLEHARNIVLLSESGIHTVTMLSRKPQGRKLRRWLADDVLPALRQTGSYSVRKKHTSEWSEDEFGTALESTMMALESTMRNRKAIHDIETRQELADDRVKIVDDRVKILEDKSVTQPGEMTALQLASRVGWRATKGGIHNLAVILAAVNEGFVDRGFLLSREREGPDGLTVSEFVFTPEGVAAFLHEIDIHYDTGESFTVTPTNRAKANGRKNRCFVTKK